jgi:hypothetical protein
MKSNDQHGDSTTYNYGHVIGQTGNNNSVEIGSRNQVSADPQAALRELVSLVIALRPQVNPASQPAIDESLAVVRQGDRADRGALSRGLGNLIGIATMAGTVGGPVVDAALKVKELLGL